MIWWTSFFCFFMTFLYKNTKSISNSPFNFVLVGLNYMNSYSCFFNWCKILIFAFIFTFGRFFFIFFFIFVFTFSFTSFSTFFLWCSFSKRRFGDLFSFWFTLSFFIPCVFYLLYWCFDRYVFFCFVFFFFMLIMIKFIIKPNLISILFIFTSSPSSCWASVVVT